MPVSQMKIFKEHLNWRAGPKVNSMDNISYRSPRTHFKIFNDKLKWTAKPKVKAISEIDLKAYNENHRFQIVKLSSHKFS